MQHPYFPENSGSNIFHQCQSENLIQVNQQTILLISEKISTDKNFKFRQAALRILNIVLASMDNDCKVAINARQLSRRLGVSYDTVTKSIKYLREIQVLMPEK